ncbi:MAG TPA: cytochrome P450 [Brevundimonas sp.]|uniref:cytochrome P450 n=1 Tax=Brevundimonas sp. TaxID=1871086 RepID=UPI002DE5B955|nr:cytochrome P450 [Brevundimonas sp.]
MTSAFEPMRRRTAGARPGRGLVTVDDAETAAAVFRDRAWGVAAILPHIQALGREGGADLSGLEGAARCSLVYQSGRDHLLTRRAMASFLSAGGVDRWRPVVDAHVAAMMDGLEAAAQPDLVRDFSRPLFAACVRDVFGLRIEDDEAAFFTDVEHARRFTEPLLRLRELVAVQAAYERLRQRVPDPDGPSSEDLPPPLAAALFAADLPPGVDPATLLVSLCVAAHTAAETLAFALWGLLKDGAPRWADVGAEGWAGAELERVLRDWPSTLRLYRLAQEATSLQGEPIAPGDLAMIDVPAVNASLCPHADVRTGQSFSFGDGVHKCPGAAFARLLISRALPALARRFPDLRVVEAEARIERTQMVQAPVALPCRLRPAARRATMRQWDVVDPVVARAIATDDVRFGPPDMARHLTALQEASGHDLSTVIRIARNAPFFLSGPRHARIRLSAFEVLGSNRVAAWGGFVDDAVASALDRLERVEAPDLVRDYCEPLFRTVCGAVLGIHPRDPASFDALASRLQVVLEPLRSLRAIVSAQEVFDGLLSLFDPSDIPVHVDRPASLLEHLAHGDPEDLDAEDRKAVVLIMYGASFNVAHTLANAVERLAGEPRERRSELIEPAAIAARLDAHIVPQAASPRFIYRIAHCDGEVEGLRFAAGDTMRLRLSAINRDLGAGHLAFGHGLHRCTGAALSRMMIRKALPALFARHPDLTLLDPAPRYADNSQTVILTALPCRLRPLPESRCV